MKLASIPALSEWLPSLSGTSQLKVLAIWMRSSVRPCGMLLALPRPSPGRSIVGQFGQ